jgi:uncharacterized membrane protein
MAEQDENARDEKAYAMRTRGIALVILGAIPALIGLVGMRDMNAGVIAALIGGLAVMAVGAALLDRAKKIRTGIL